MSMEGTQIRKNSESEDRDFEKMRVWERAKKEVEGAADMLGYGVDEGIKETIIALNTSGLPTSSSCEGHIGRGFLLPWVQVSAPDEPEERFEGEADLARNIAGKYGVTEEDVRRANNEDAWREWRLTVSEGDGKETATYKEWRKENNKLRERAAILLREFYRDYIPDEGMRIVIDGGAGGSFRIHSESKYASFQSPLDAADREDDETKKYRALQEKARKEIGLFTKSLREKYFAS